MIKRAIISVSDKTGIIELAHALHGMDIQILSTGGTAKVLGNEGIPVTNISDITGYPECLDGRVKTLHPAIHGGLLAMRNNPAHMEQIQKLHIEPIDLVVINLYPFKQTILKPDVAFEEAIENIDIGGPAMLRAAAKNWQDVAVMVDSADYPNVLEQIRTHGEVDLETKKHLCYKVFAHTSEYDTLVAQYLREQVGETDYPDTLTLAFEKSQSMRYGENPHQRAVLYRQSGKPPIGLLAAEQLQGKPLSYNNINDANAALDLLREFNGSLAVVAVKHMNPCGAAQGDSVYQAFHMAYQADPQSITGSVVVTNTAVDGQTAQEMAKTFLEIIVAPRFTDEALGVFEQKKNLCLLTMPSMNQPLPASIWDAKKVVGGLLVQDMDLALLGENLQIVTKRAPEKDEMEDLEFAWKVAKHAKSNAIVIAKDKHSLGIGSGQINRIWAIELAIEHSGDNARGAVMAADAFLPLADCVEMAAKAGITAIIQLGGTNDQEAIDACNRANIAMVYTGIRHLRH